tara:strand:+ start:416 stop:883 length:468 start_codon:yes stop_codon:yes gene_type:complete
MEERDTLHKKKKMGELKKNEKEYTLPAVEMRNFYSHYLKMLQPILQLRKREADVFAELLYHNFLRRNISNKEDRAILVFNTATRKKIQEKLGISNAVIQQALGGLRKKNAIIGINLRESFTVEPKDGVFKLTFNFKVQKDIDLSGLGGDVNNKTV